MGWEGWQEQNLKISFGKWLTRFQFSSKTLFMPKEIYVNTPLAPVDNAALKTLAKESKRCKGRMAQILLTEGIRAASTKPTAIQLRQAKP